MGFQTRFITVLGSGDFADMQAQSRGSTENLALNELLHHTHVVVAPTEHANVVSHVVDADQKRFCARCSGWLYLERRAERHVVRCTELRDLLPEGKVSTLISQAERMEW